MGVRARLQARTRQLGLLSDRFERLSQAASRFHLRIAHRDAAKNRRLGIREVGALLQGSEERHRNAALAHAAPPTPCWSARNWNMTASHHASTRPREAA